MYIRNNRLHNIPDYKFLFHGRAILEKMIKSMSHLDESSFEILVDDLVARFVTKCSDDKISDVLEYLETTMTSSDMTSSHDYGPITILVCQLISILSYHPGHVDKFRRPRNLSSLDCAPELEDSKLLKSVIFRFQLLGKWLKISKGLSLWRRPRFRNINSIDAKETAYQFGIKNDLGNTPVNLEVDTCFQFNIYVSILETKTGINLETGINFQVNTRVSKLIFVILS